MDTAILPLAITTMAGPQILESEGHSFSAALPFIGLTAAIAALPLAFYVLFRQRAQVTVPKVRDWMNANTWLVNISVYAIFIVLILS